MDALDDMVTFRAELHAAIFTIGVQPTLADLAAYWVHLNTEKRAVAADAAVIAAKNKSKQELGAA
jgi:hypothetical protein